MKKIPRVAIVYDRVNKFGGAERVLLALRELYPDSVLFTSVHDPAGAPWASDWEVRTSFLQCIPFARRHHEWFALLMPWAFESLDFTGFDLVISVTSEFAKNILTSPEQKHICYCLTPTRYLWSHTREYGRGRMSAIKQVLFSYLRPIDLDASQRPDQMLAISSVVQSRISKYYRRRSNVVYPPTTLLPRKRQKKRGNYYLVVSRLVPYKRIDLALEVCKRSRRHLHIVGVGSDAIRLLELAADSPYIHFEGEVDDRKLSELYSGARALICPQEEDFGLVSIEAQAHGTPVVSYARSGVAETVLDGKTGILFTEQTESGLLSALAASDKAKWNEKTIRSRALKFNKEAFQREFRRAVK